MAFVYWVHLPEHTDMLSQGYIGFTSKTVDIRWRQHIEDSRRYPHLTFYRALSKYFDKLVIDILVEGSSEYCLDIENKLRPDVKIGWNIKIGGDFGSLGVIASEETRKKMSEVRTGDKNHFFGKTHSDEQKANWRKTRGGKPFSDEAKTKTAETKKNNPWNVANARKDIWINADKFFNVFKKGMGMVELARLCELPKHCFKAIHVKLKSGWNPAVDPYWIKFKENYKEAENV